MGKKRGVMSFPQSIRIVTSIVVFAVLFAICISLLQLIHQNEEARAQRFQEMEDALQVTQEKLDQQISTLYQMAASVHKTSALRKVALYEYNIVDELNAMSQLENLMSNPMLVYSYYYARGTQRLFASGGEAYQFPEGAAYFQPYEGIDTQQLNELFVCKGGLRMLPSCVKWRDQNSGVIVAAVPIPINSTNPYATLLMEISPVKLLQIIMPTLDTESIFVFEQNDVPIFSNSSQYTELASLERVEEGKALYEGEGQVYLLFSCEGKSAADTSVRMYVPEETMRAGLLSSLQKWMIAFACVCMMLLLCPLLYKWTYQPMKLLMEKLLEDQKPAGFMHSDYAIILREIEQLRQNNTVMLGEIGLNTNRIKASLVRSLLEYKKTPEDFMRLCERADLSFRYPYFRLVLSTARAAQAYTDEYFLKLARENTDVYAVKAPDMLYLLINAQDQTSSYDLVKELESMNVIESAEKCYFGRSGWVDDPALLHSMYRRSLDKLSQNLFHGAIGYSEEPESDHTGETARSYPINEILLLHESVMDSDREQTKEAVQQVQHYLLHEDTRNTVAVLAADDVLSTLQRHSHADLSALMERVHSPNINAAEVCQILREGLEMVEKAAERSSADTLTEEMMLYISERLEDPNLSSATVGEYFGMSESAFSHAFKKRTGSTFIKYVTDLKIQRAKTLLICTDMSVEAIAEQLCYSSASSFTRMFKSVTALTPTQYRKLDGENT